MEYTPFQKNAIKEFRQEVGAEDDVPDYHLTRWLAARGWDMDKAVAMYTKNQEWRREWKVDSLLEWEIPEVLSLYYPAGMLGYDGDGGPVWLALCGRCDVRGLFSSATAEDIIRYTLVVIERSFREMEKQTKALNRPITLHSAVFDLEYFSLKQVASKQVMKAILKMVQFYEANYPEALKRVMVINAPFYFSVVYSMITPFLTDTTLKKINIYGTSGWKEEVLDLVPSEILPAHWGGDRTDPDGNPMCPSMVCLGGEIPKSYYLVNKQEKNKMLASEKQPSQTNLQRKELTSGTKSLITLEVKQPGSEFRWKLLPEKEQVMFAVSLCLSDGRTEQFIPPMAVSTGEMEEGFLICSKPGNLNVEVYPVPGGHDQQCQVSFEIDPPSRELCTSDS